MTAQAGNNGGGPNPAAAFAAVMQRAAPLPAPSARIVASDNVAEFIEACHTAVWAGLGEEVNELLPGVDVTEPRSVLKAYLLFLATEGLTRNSEDIDGERVKGWCERVQQRVWDLLGFKRQPGLLTMQLAFSLLGSEEHLTTAMRPLVWVVGDFAAIGLLRELRV